MYDDGRMAKGDKILHMGLQRSLCVVLSRTGEILDLLLRTTNDPEKSRYVFESTETQYASTQALHSHIQLVQMCLDQRIRM